MIRCFKPLITLTDCDGRFTLHLNDCYCNAPNIVMELIRDGCAEYEEIVELKECNNYSFGCFTLKCSPQVTITYKEKPRPKLVYPLHEIDCDGRAVFVFDNKLALLGHGRYTAYIKQQDRELACFDIDYVPSRLQVGDITTEQRIWEAY